MKIEVIAYAVVRESALASLGYQNAMARDIDNLHEFSGRLCYLSFDRPNPATAENKDYLKNIIDSGHESVLAHGHVTFLISGISRACAHEMIRHRFLAFSEVSQRYVDPKRILEFTGDPDRFVLRTKQYDLKFKQLREEGQPLKAARGEARKELPLGFPTVQVVSGNIRAWRDFVKQRNTEHADAEIREVAQTILARLRDLSPNSVQDL